MIIEPQSSGKGGIITSIVLSIFVFIGISAAVFQYVRKKNTGSELLKESKTTDFTETEQPAFDANDLIRNRKENDMDSIVDNAETLGNETLKSARREESVKSLAVTSEQVGEQIERAIANS